LKTGAAIAVVVAAAAIAGGAWWNWNRASGDDVAGTVTDYVTPEQRTIASTVLATGIVRLRVGAEVRVGSQLSGIVEELNVIVGSEIKEGDVIARIDSRGLQARLDQAQAQVAVLEQERRRAEVELDRAKQLGVEKLVAATDIEDRKLDLAAVQARLEKARRDAAVVETDLDYAVIRAPISGTVASVTTQKGETVAAAFSTPTFATIIATDAMELVAMVDETDIGNIAAGNPVLFTVEAYPSMEFEGRVKQIAPKGSIISGVVNFEVMAVIDTDVQVLKPDMTANVSIRTAERDAWVLPSQAVQRDGFDYFVFIDEGGERVKRSVAVGTREAGFTEIRQGLGPDERVVTGVSDSGLSGGRED
jgi:RND family efflux transporter MFP subunit